jgi:hypothetical protein
LRGAKPFYDDVASALAATKLDVDERMRRHGRQRRPDSVHPRQGLHRGRSRRPMP